MAMKQNEDGGVDRLDAVDLQILRAMQNNGRLTIKELAAQVARSQTPVFERLKKLESEGYIKKYIAVLDADKLNQGFMVFCNIRMLRINKEIAERFMARMMEVPQVTECYNISGKFDYLLKVHARNMKDYQQFVLNTLGTIEGLASLESTFVMDVVKHDYGVNVVG